eukprot:6442516-Alexandrium_andersonii.AAC.1
MALEAAETASGMLPTPAVTCAVVLLKEVGDVDDAVDEPLFVGLAGSLGARSHAGGRGTGLLRKACLRSHMG